MAATSFSKTSIKKRDREYQCSHIHASWLLPFHLCWFQCKPYHESPIVKIPVDHNDMISPLQHFSSRKKKTSKRKKKGGYVTMQEYCLVLQSSNRHSCKHSDCMDIPLIYKKILNRLSLLTGPFNRYSCLCLVVICIVNVCTILFYIKTETDCFI